MLCKSVRFIFLFFFVDGVFVQEVIKKTFTFSLTNEKIKNPQRHTVLRVIMDYNNLSKNHGHENSE